MAIIRLAKVNDAIKLYNKMFSDIGANHQTFTKEFMEAAHAFNHLNKEEQREMMLILGLSMTQITKIEAKE